MMSREEEGTSTGKSGGQFIVGATASPRPGSAVCMESTFDDYHDETIGRNGSLVRLMLKASYPEAREHRQNGDSSMTRSVRRAGRCRGGATGCSQKCL